MKLSFNLTNFGFLHPYLPEEQQTALWESPICLKIVAKVESTIIDFPFELNNKMNFHFEALSEWFSFSQEEISFIKGYFHTLFIESIDVYPDKLCVSLTPDRPF
jgi:hypothetical protein